jgi:hypothetical protein
LDLPHAKPARGILMPPWPMDLAGALTQAWSMTRGTTWLRENQAIQLSTDGRQLGEHRGHLRHGPAVRILRTEDS